MINLSFEDLASDRITSLIGYYELKKLTPDRKWNYIAIDVEGGALKENKSLIEKLIYPQDTVMDLSIGTALFFGAQGDGKTFDDESKIQDAFNSIITEFPKMYTESMGGKQGEIKVAALKNKKFIEAFNLIKAHLTVDKKSDAKVILNGLGADEIFGGYSRYYTYLKNNQIKELQNEFSLDLDRLWIRNFGRDDRCIEYHGKCCIFPYLDLEVIEYSSRIPMSELFYKDELYKLNKKVLRDLATKIGFK